MKKILLTLFSILALIVISITIQSEGINLTRDANAQYLECPDERCREGGGCDYSAPGRKCTWDFGECSGYEYCN